MVAVIKVKSSDEKVSVGGSDDYYPYGTSLDLEKDLIDQLDIDSLNVGDTVEVYGTVVIESKSERQDKDEDSKSMVLQFTDINVKSDKSDRAGRLYGDE